MTATGKVIITRKMGYLWVVLPDTITVDTNLEIESRIESYLQPKDEKLVLDFSNTYSLFSSGLGLMIRLRKKVAESGGLVCLVNVSRRVREFLSTLNLDRVFPIYTTDVEFEVSREDIWNSKHAEQPFLFVAQVENGVYRINISGDMTVGCDFSMVKSFTPKHEIGIYIIDLSGLEMIDSGSAAVLFDLIERIRRQGGTCRAYGADQIIADLLTVLGIDQRVTMFPDEKTAIEGG
jgi:anti-anti-sigma factor